MNNIEVTESLTDQQKKIVEAITMLMLETSPKSDEKAEVKSNEEKADTLPQKTWLTINEACKHLGVSRTSLYRLVKEEKLQSCRVRSRILIEREVLDRSLREGLLG